MDAREESWRAEGWQGYQAAEAAIPVGMTGSGAAEREPVLDASDEGTIEVVEENLRVGKRDSRPGPGAGPLLRRRDPGRGGCRRCAERRCISSASRSTGRSVAGEAFVDRTIEATETAEEAVVSKEARVTEEISLGKAVDSRTETVRDTVRHTEVEVEDERLDRTK